MKKYYIGYIKNRDINIMDYDISKYLELYKSNNSTRKILASNKEEAAKIYHKYQSTNY
jgi:hypothetical protein